MADSTTGARKRKPPTVSYLLALKSEKIKEFQLDDAEIDMMRQVRTLQRQVLMDDSLRLVDVEVRDPTINWEIQHTASTLSLNWPKLMVTPSRPDGDAAEDNATLRQEFTQETFKVAGTRLEGQDAFRDGVDSCAGDGGLWWQFLFTNDVWKNRYSVDNPDSGQYDRLTEDAKKAAGPPFTWTTPDVRTLYPVREAGKLAEMLVITKQTTNSALRQFRLGLDENYRLVPEDLGIEVNMVDNPRVPDMVTVLEHWDDTYASVLVEIEDDYLQGVANAEWAQSEGPNPDRQWEHGYGRVPFFYAPAYTMNWQHGRKIGWGVAKSMRWLVEYRSYLLSLEAQVAARDAMPPVWRRRNANNAAAESESAAIELAGDPKIPQAKEHWEARELINLDEGEEMGVLQFPGISSSIKEMLGNITALIDKLSVPRISNDIGGSDPGSGFAINQILAETRIEQDPLTKNIERALNDMTWFFWKLCREKVRETIWVRRSGENSGWLKADPMAGDLDENVGIAWELNPERPSAELIEERYYGERMANRTLARHQAIKRMHDNPDEVDELNDLDEIRQSPFYKARRLDLLMKKLQRGDILKDAAAQAIQSGQLPGQQPLLGPPGAPPAMGSPIVPDMGKLAASPGGGSPIGPPGRQPITVAQGGGAPPTQSALPGAQFGG